MRRTEKNMKTNCKKWTQETGKRLIISESWRRKKRRDDDSQRKMRERKLS